MVKRNKVLYASQGAPRVNGHLLYRINCIKCGKYDPNYKDWVEDPRTIITGPVDWCECKKENE